MGLQVDKELDAALSKTCARHGVKPVAAPETLKVGIARNVKEGVQPINGLRIQPEGDATGWYIWAGTAWSDAPDFFVPLHVEHLRTWCPEVLPYLLLPPGWRFLLAPGHEDVWYDDKLVTTPS
jgi:hypothetical protein